MIISAEPNISDIENQAFIAGRNTALDCQLR